MIQFIVTYKVIGERIFLFHYYLSVEVNIFYQANLYQVLG